MSEAMYEGDLRVFMDDEEWVIARDAADVQAVFQEMQGGPTVSNFHECPPGRSFTFDGDAGPITKTYAEWAKERGRGWFACANY